jgi:integrase/recombinase XerC
VLTTRKRGETYHVDYLIGRKHAVRGSLGTRDGAVARRLTHRLEIALSEGARSREWSELGAILPPETFARFAEHVGVEEKRIATWKELCDLFESHKDRLVRIDQLSAGTRENYRRTLDQFDCFLAENHITVINAIRKPEMERYKEWRLARISKPNCTGVPTLRNELSHLHHLFEFARDNELIDQNPVRKSALRYRPSGGAQPFSSDELRRLRAQAEWGPGTLFFPFSPDLLPFLLARWTGMRCWDLITLPWKDVLFERKEIEHICHKNRKTVILQIPDELLVVLKAEFERRKPQPNEPVLRNPKTGRPYTHMAFWYFVKQLGKKSGVHHAHPHRFRDTFAVEMLWYGDKVNDVAQALGDTMLTVENYYISYVEELRQRARLRMEGRRGFEQLVTPASQ